MKLYMQTMLLFVSLLAYQSAPAEHTQIIEMDVHGMTCGFCVYGLKKKLGKLAGIASVEVSLKNHKVRLTMEPGAKPDEKLYKETIRQSGFTSAGDSHYVVESHP